MNNNLSSNRYSTDSSQESFRRKREGVIIIAIIFIVAFLTFLENRIVKFGTDIPVSNTVLMFILININLLLLILLIFLVFRNLFKLLYDRKKKAMGAKLRTKLVIAFGTLTLLPTIILFFFSISFITTSIEFWFNVPVEQALENSLDVGRYYYDRIEDNNRFYLERISYQINSKKLIDPLKQNSLSQYLAVVQRSFNINAIELYNSDFKRISFALAPELDNLPLDTITPDNIRKDMSPKNVRIITEKISQGELVRIIGTVPFGVQPNYADGYIVLTTLISNHLSNKMKSISLGFEEYQQIKLVKKPIQLSYYILLSIVALLVLFCAIWFGFYLAKSITIPIMELADGTRRVAEGDLGFSINIKSDDEIGSLVDSFNKMTKDLRTGREQLELSAKRLGQQNIEIEERRRYMEIVLKNISTGVITLDADGIITTINKSAEKMLNLEPNEIIGKSYKNLLKDQHLNLAGEIMESLAASKDNAVELPLRLSIGERRRSFLINVNALKDDSEQHMGLVMVFDDLTELEKAQRVAAWREVARRIAHEVKNPLTPIKLSAQRIKRKYSKQINEPVFEECTRMIIDHVDLIKNIVNEFSSFARFPAANPVPCDLPPIIRETVALYKEGHHKIIFSMNIPDNIPRLNLDRQQIKQAMINLVDNAVAAIKDHGNIVITLWHDNELKTVGIEVADDGAGVSEEDKSRLFEPNFSTKKTGSGLGLTIVNTIINDHKGVIRVQDNYPKGTKFIIELPVI
ncbi:MAG: two-component system, NtrC family, nitrogen regulation sensor histidine kinase NtrY [Thermodesulfobacteriota bacterium]|nr:two-component system, NtrC family, nitrogen regulation sensor histidine kinase NtrY [Thermodesulfobacteriota bacterium]